MNLKNYDIIEEQTKDWNESSKLGVRANYKKMLAWLSSIGELEEKEGIYYTDIPVEDINNFIIRVGSITSYQSITIRVLDFTKFFNEVLGIDVKFHNIPPNEVVKDNKGIYTKEEITAICNQFINAQDRFLIYGLWYGLKEKKFEDITAIKVSDVNFENNIIKIGNKSIVMDNTLKTYCLLAIEQKEYFKLGDAYDNTNDSYMLNKNNPYIIKVKPQINNNNGMNRMTFNGLRTRIANLNYSLEEYNVLLKPQKLYMGGVIHKMYEEAISNNIQWNNSTIKQFKEKYNLKIFSVDTLLAYKSKYGNI